MVASNTEITDKELIILQTLLSFIVKTEIMLKYLIGIVVSATGKILAFWLIFINELIDGSVKYGLLRK
ncbi:hypothetical protein A9G24_05520 [Gilliamella sp. App6-5]|uniref:hypothetical protein n=1 Tax=Gilliamella sp. App6-5 TaxID=3120232 RepID=UPI00080ED0AC|nr:hypothetical protein [Gilliamella apicola]OCG15251.1 hypothetical protein A9G24_05520 [Gilliamella apicola]